VVVVVVSTIIGLSVTTSDAVAVTTGSEVWSGIALLLVEHADEAVVGGCDDGAEERAKPVNPMVAWEAAVGDTGTEAAGWVEGGAGVEEA
jgi:hypothetical protein